MTASKWALFITQANAMAIPLLDYPLTSQNARVSNLAGDLHDNGLATISYGGAGHDSYNAEVMD